MRRTFISVLCLVVLAGCGAAGSPSPSAPTSEGFRLRAWLTQALPPAGAFGTAGDVIGIGDGRLIVHGPQIELFPPPLFPNLQEQPISDAGVQAILAAATSAGLLTGPTDLTDNLPPGGQTAHLLFEIDGVKREVTGDPTRQMVCITTPCEAPAGTPEAFGGFWARLSDAPNWLGSEIGAAAPFRATRLALLLTEPQVDPNNEPPIVRWPLDGEMNAFGVAFAGSQVDRCGVVDGDDLATVLNALGGANAQTHVTDGIDAIHLIVVRPLFPDEPDPCGS